MKYEICIFLFLSIQCFFFFQNQRTTSNRASLIKNFFPYLNGDKLNVILFKKINIFKYFQFNKCYISLLSKNKEKN